MWLYVWGIDNALSWGIGICIVDVLYYFHVSFLFIVGYLKHMVS